MSVLLKAGEFNNCEEGDVRELLEDECQRMTLEGAGR